MRTQRRLEEPLTTRLQADVYGISVEILDEWWPHVTEYLQKAIDRADGRWNLESIRQKLLSRDMQLWVIVSNKILAAGISQIVEYPLRKVCVVSFLGGEELSLWHDKSIATIERAALDWGCDDVDVQGRKGWERAMKRHGYEQTYCVIRKHIRPS